MLRKRSLPEIKVGKGIARVLAVKEFEQAGRFPTVVLVPVSYGQVPASSTESGSNRKHSLECLLCLGEMPLQKQ